MPAFVCRGGSRILSSAIKRRYKSEGYECNDTGRTKGPRLPLLLTSLRVRPRARPDASLSPYAGRRQTPRHCSLLVELRVWRRSFALFLEYTRYRVPSTEAIPARVRFGQLRASAHAVDRKASCKSKLRCFPRLIARFDRVRRDL